MTLTRTAPRALIVAVFAGLLLMGLPIEQVRAEERPPETKLVELDTLSEKVEEPAGTEGGDAADETDSPAPPDQTAVDEDGWLTSEVTEAPIPFTMLGFRGTGEPEVWFRVADSQGWTDWEAVEFLETVDGPDPGTAEEEQAEALQADH